MALFSFIDLDAKKLEPLVIALLGAGALYLLYLHMQQSSANAQADQASQASADYINTIEQMAELQALTGNTATGTSTTGASELPTYSGVSATNPNSATVAPSLTQAGTVSAGGATNGITFEIPSLPFSTVSTNFGGPNTGSGA